MHAVEAHVFLLCVTGTPIIVVPAGFSDLFTMLNVKDFLEDGVYVPNMQKKAEGCRKAQSIILQHEEDGEQYTFKIIDSVARFRDKDWCALAKGIRCLDAVGVPHAFLPMHALYITGAVLSR